ncbi:MAG TPA: cyclophilin-like fold protein [Syntrophorhabdaceae bacterium]|nr:cyclophilin-like fold protein [Syntrophorhabdaceae bacterium]
MSAKVRITVGHIAVQAIFNETGCSLNILSKLPLTVSFNKWGDEFYFEVPVMETLDETATTDVHVGDIGYWPPGNALAIFFGPTPLSRGKEPVPAGEVNIVGKITGDATVLRNAIDSIISLEQIS